MKIGILSDTHGRLHMMTAAVALLTRHGAQHFLHCGDVGGPDLLDPLAGLPAAFVYGNNDYDRTELRRYAQSIDVTCLADFGELDLAGKRFALTHGDDVRLVKRLLDQQAHDYLLLGHSHVPRDERVGRTRVLNPGALHRAARKTVMLLDVPTDTVSLLTVADGA